MSVACHLARQGLGGVGGARGGGDPRVGPEPSAGGSPTMGEAMPMTTTTIGVPGVAGRDLTTPLAIVLLA